MKATFYILGIFVGILSTISLIVRVFDVGLTSIFEDFVRFYQQIAHSLVDLLNRLLHPLDMPYWCMDFLLLYVVLVGMCFRYDIASNLYGRLESQKFYAFVANNVGETFADNHQLSIERIHLAIRSILLIPIWKLTFFFDISGILDHTPRLNPPRYFGYRWLKMARVFFKVRFVRSWRDNYRDYLTYVRLIWADDISEEEKLLFEKFDQPGDPYDFASYTFFERYHFAFGAMFAVPVGTMLFFAANAYL